MWADDPQPYDKSTSHAAAAQRVKTMENPFSVIKFGRAPFTFWYHMGLWVSTICMDLNSIHQKIWELFKECHPLNHCYEVICVGSLKFFFECSRPDTTFPSMQNLNLKRLSRDPAIQRSRVKKKTFLMDSEKKDDLLGFLFQEHFFRTMFFRCHPNSLTFLKTTKNGPWKNTIVDSTKGASRGSFSQKRGYPESHGGGVVVC